MSQPKVNIDQLNSANIADARAVGSSQLFGYNFTTSTGLTFGYYGGTISVNGVLTTIANSTILLTASVVNYVECDAAGVVYTNTTGFTAGRTPLYELTTDTTTITAMVDRRLTNSVSPPGVLTKSVAGGTNITLTAAETRNAVLVFTGALTANISVIIPAIAKTLTVHNNTSGAFTLTVKTPAGTGVGIMQGKRSVVMCDGTNVYRGHDDIASFDGVPGWDDLLSDFVGAKLGSGVNAPTWTLFQGGVYAYAYSASALNEAWLCFHIPHNYMPGTNMYPHIHWTTPGTNTGVVRWGFEFTAARGYNRQAFGATTTVYLEQAASGTAFQHMIAEDAVNAVIPAAALEPDTILMVHVFRDGAHANDTCTDVAFGLEVDLHYQTGDAATKNRNYPFS